MAKIYSYIIPVDDGAAPNPFGGICTLTICKPAIRRNATAGCWIIGTGSKHTRLQDGHFYDLSKTLVYAMKVTDRMSLADYDTFCRKQLTIKIPDWNSKRFEKRVGECLYDYSEGTPPIQRAGVHGPGNIKTDLGGKNALLSDHFYYFGSKSVLIPKELYGIIHTTQNCKLIRDADTVSRFETWISQFGLNKIVGEPQLKYLFDNNLGGTVPVCVADRLKNNKGQNDSLC